MSRYPVIVIGAGGVDMRQNPLFLSTNRASSATNMTFDESTIKTRFDINYHDLNLKGQFQGFNYFTPSTGLSAVSYSNAASSLVTVVKGAVCFNVITEDGISDTPVKLDDFQFKGDTYLFDAENYLVIVNDNSPTFWSDAGGELVRSQGLTQSGGATHDKLTSEENANWLPNFSTLGHYIHGRTHISVDFGPSSNSTSFNSEVWVSDIIGKRSLDDCSADDILKMEEAMLDSGGGTLIAPSRLGKTLAFETLLSSGNNGEGVFVDFRECGVVFHDTFQTPRETLIGEDDNILTPGWDERRITNVQLQTISAVGRYSVYQLPDDIWFRSEYGFHYLKKTLGTGTVKDEKRNHESHDIQPLLDLDEDGPLEGVSTGYWLRNDRLMGTVGMAQNPMYSSSAMGRGFVVLNQASTYTEDDTPRPLWEGLWLPDENIAGIHKFSRIGQRNNNNQFGFICSDVNRNIFAGELVNKRTGYDTRKGVKSLIPWQYTSGAFAFSSIDNVDSLRSGYLDFIGDESTSDVEIEIRTDQHQCWEPWTTIETSFKSKSLKSIAFGEPSARIVREATWFQFRIKGLGYVEIRTFDIDAVTVDVKNDGRNHIVPVCCEPDNYFEI